MHGKWSSIKTLYRRGKSGLPSKRWLYSCEFWTVGVVLCAILYRFLLLGSHPDGYQVDEMGSAYDAWALLHYGVDRYQTGWPVYFVNYSTGQSALLTYAMVISMYFFGFNRFAIRLPMVFCSLLILFCGLGIIDLIWKDGFPIRREAARLLFAILYLIVPYMQMNARIGLDCNMMLGMSTAFLYTVLLAVDHAGKGDKFHFVYFLLSGTVGGLTLYTYAISYLVVPLFLLCILVYFIYCRGITWNGGHGTVPAWDIFLMAVPLAILAFPLILEQYVNATDREAITLLGIFTVTKMSGYRGSEIGFDHFFQKLCRSLRSVFLYDDIDYNTNRFSGRCIP